MIQTARVRVVSFALGATVAAVLLAPKLFAQEKEPIDVVKVNTDLVVFDTQVIDKKTKRVIGDLSNTERVLVGLQLRPGKSAPE